MANAIEPEGLLPLEKKYAPRDTMGWLADWYGHRHPEASGFATRERWAKEMPQNAQVQRLWGEALLRDMRLTEAEMVLEKTITLAPDSPRAHLALGDLLMMEGISAKAGLEYTTCLRLKPNWMPALLGLGNVALEKNLLAMGVEVFETATKQDPRNVNAWIGMGRAYYNQRLNLGKSLACFETAVRLDPSRTDFYPDYSNALSVNYRYAEAETVLRKHLAEAPGEAKSHFLLALILLDHQPGPEREVEAEKELRESLRLEPDAVTCRARLGRLLVDKGQDTEGIPLLQTGAEAGSLQPVRPYRRWFVPSIEPGRNMPRK